MGGGPAGLAALYGVRGAEGGAEWAGRGVAGGQLAARRRGRGGAGRAGRGAAGGLGGLRVGAGRGGEGRPGRQGAGRAGRGGAGRAVVVRVAPPPANGWRSAWRAATGEV